MTRRMSGQRRPQPMTREAKLIAAPIMLAYTTAVLMAHAAPRGAAMYQRTYNPEPGDLVVEQSTLHVLAYSGDLTDDRWDGQFVTFARYERVTHKGDESEDDWTETVLVCIQPDGSEFRWTNASLHAVPTSMRWPEDLP